MSNVRQYIGARYVPIIYGQWDNTVSYEPLTIVQYQGASYTSRQYVPIGIDITNNDYWALTGNYNAQVESYRQEVQTFDDRITDNHDDIVELNELNASLTTHVRKTVDWYTPEQYGAYGDGVHDDTAAFEDMLSAMQDGDLCVLQSPEYKVTRTLHITKHRMRFSGISIGNTKPVIKFVFNSYDNATCVLIEASCISFSNIHFSQGNHPQTLGTDNFILRFETQNLPNDNTGNWQYNIDAIVTNCCFYRAENAIGVIGRNIIIRDNLFTTIRSHPFVILPYESSYEMRGYRIENNRFHIAGWGIDTSRVTQYTGIFNLTIKDNFFDYCSVIYIGITDNVTISNNEFYQSITKEVKLIRFHNTINLSSSATVEGNIYNSQYSYASVGGEARPTEGLIEIWGQCGGTFNINNNTFITRFTSAQDDNNSAVIVINCTNESFININGNIIYTADRFTPIQITNPDEILHGTITGNIVVTYNSSNFITASHFIVDNNYTANSRTF